MAELEIDYNKLMDRDSKLFYEIAERITELRDKLDLDKTKTFDELAKSENYKELLHLEGLVHNVVFSGEEVIEIVQEGNSLKADYEKLDKEYVEFEKKYNQLIDDNEKLRGNYEDLKNKHDLSERVYFSLSSENQELKSSLDEKIGKIKLLTRGFKGDLVDRINEIISKK
ncbi:MAG: hypothetical protein Q7S33_00540 [Nanoarchaeota archaeon]|nr:hypothetical protein [Nanoarchaeota archaeon]